LRPDLHIFDLRGNVDTRLRKLEEGHYEAIVLAAAGMKRLGLESHITEYFSPDVLLPAAGQGALGIETRRDDPAVKEIISCLQHQPSAEQVRAERAFLNQLGGGCQVPIAAYCSREEQHLCLKGLIGHPSGTPFFRGELRDQGHPERLGLQLGQWLLAQGGDGILRQLEGQSGR
jgi:hydroxymethylbilane synthase